MRAAERLVAILEAVVSTPTPSTPTTVARATELSVSTAGRLMQQMAEARLLAQGPSTGTYVLGSRIFALAHAGAHQNELVSIARPTLEALRAESGETSSLHVRAGADRVCIDMAVTAHAIGRLVTTGATYPLVGSATGDAFLSTMSAMERGRVFDAAGLDDHARQEAERHVVGTQERGYAISVGRWAEGVASISCPVVTGGLTVAAISISGPSDRLSADTARVLGPVLVEATARLGQRL